MIQVFFPVAMTICIKACSSWGSYIEVDLSVYRLGAQMPSKLKPEQFHSISSSSLVAGEHYMNLTGAG